MGIVFTLHRKDRRYDSQRRLIIYLIISPYFRKSDLDKTQKNKIFAPTTITVIRCHCTNRWVVDFSHLTWLESKVINHWQREHKRPRWQLLCSIHNKNGINPPSSGGVYAYKSLTGMKTHQHIFIDICLYIYIFIDIYIYCHWTLTWTIGLWGYLK